MANEDHKRLILQGIDNTIQHEEPSALNVDTIMRSEGAMPIEFLRGIGLNECFISFLRNLSQN